MQARQTRRLRRTGWGQWKNPSGRDPLRYCSSMQREGRILLLGPLAFSGAVAGHALGYLVSHPGEDARSEILLLTGHGSFGRLVMTAVAAAVAGVVILALRSGTHIIGFRWLAARLLPLQLGIFAWLELAERGFDVGRTLSDPAVLVGLAAQVLVALAAATLARGVQATVRSIRSAIPRTLRAPARLPRPATTAFPRTRLEWRWDGRRRAPPLRLAA